MVSILEVKAKSFPLNRFMCILCHVGDAYTEGGWKLINRRYMMKCKHLRMVNLCMLISTKRLKVTKREEMKMVYYENYRYQHWYKCPLSPTNHPIHRLLLHAYLLFIDYNMSLIYGTFFS